MDQTAYICQSLKTIWNASILPSLIPGGLIYDLVYSGTDYPYASIEILLGETQFTTGLIYAQDYHCEISVWATDSMATAGTIQTALYQTFNQNTRLASLISPARLLQTCMDTGGISEDPERNLAKLTLIAKIKLIFTIQQARA